MTDRTEHYKKVLADEQESLAGLESGKWRLSKRDGDGPEVDITQEWIERHKRNILLLTEIIAKG